jgi:hypothetical protein
MMTFPSASSRKAFSTLLIVARIVNRLSTSWGVSKSGIPDPRSTKRYSFNLNQSTQGQSGHLYRRPGRGILGKELGIDGIHSLKIVNTVQENSYLYNPVKAGAGSSQHRPQVGERPTSLSLDAALDQFSSGGVYAELTGCKDKITRANALGIGPDRCRGLLSNDDLTGWRLAQNFCATHLGFVHLILLCCDLRTLNS